MMGGNKLEIMRKGDIYTGRLNGSLIWEIDAESCEAPALIPSMSDLEKAGKAYFTGMKAEFDYSGVCEGAFGLMAAAL